MENDGSVSKIAKSVAANKLGCATGDIVTAAVSGGYSRNRRSLLGFEGKWVFAKEVDKSLLPSDGEEEMAWLKKDYECTKLLRQRVPEHVSQWSELAADGHVLLMSSYRKEDGWLWSLPSEQETQYRYIQAVIDATKKFEAMKFSEDEANRLNLQPYFRDKLALDGGLDLVLENDATRDQLIDKYTLMRSDEELSRLYGSIDDMLIFLNDRSAIKEVADHARRLAEQPNDRFNHCDVRSDNIAFNPSTNEVIFVDWNWASYAPTKFGPSEFLSDMARNGVDVTPWVDEVNPELLAAVVGYYAKRSLEDPLLRSNALREMQAESAAVALSLYKAFREHKNDIVSDASF